MTNVSVKLTPDSTQPFLALAYVPWSLLSSNMSKERAKIYLPGDYKVRNVRDFSPEDGVQEVRIAYSMPISDRVIDAWILETDLEEDYTNQSPRSYLSGLTKQGTNAIPTDTKSDLAELDALLRNFHLHHISWSPDSSHGTNPNPPLLLTTAFSSSGIDANLLARAFIEYPFSFRIYQGGFPSYGEGLLRGYDGTIIVADAENADGLADRIKETLNPEIIIVTREALVGTKLVDTKKVFANNQNRIC